MVCVISVYCIYLNEFVDFNKFRFFFFKIGYSWVF